MLGPEKGLRFPIDLLGVLRVVERMSMCDGSEAMPMPLLALFYGRGAYDYGFWPAGTFETPQGASPSASATPSDLRSAGSNVGIRIIIHVAPIAGARRTKRMGWVSIRTLDRIAVQVNTRIVTLLLAGSARCSR
jgi:hypothetical protein